MDWNEQKYAEIWRQGWSDTVNRYLEAIGSLERLDLRSYVRQGIDKIPTVHMGPAASRMEQKGTRTNIGNLNRDIRAANRLMQSIRQTIRNLKKWVAGLKEKKALLSEALQQAKMPTIRNLLSRYMDARSDERSGWTSRGQLKGIVRDFDKVMAAVGFLEAKGVTTVAELDGYLDETNGKALAARTGIKDSERRIREIDTTFAHITSHESYKDLYKKYAAIGWKGRKDKFAAEHREELDAYFSAVRYFKAHQGELPYDTKALKAERAQLADGLSGQKGRLQEIHEELKVLRDVRNWINQVLPPEERRAVAEPGKKASVTERLNWKAEKQKNREAPEHQPSRKQEKHNHEF